MNSSLMIEKINDLATSIGPVSIMEFCGGHTHALVKSGVLELLPNNIKMIHGPGCPVCVLPPNHIQAVINLLEQRPHMTVFVYGDLMRIPTLGGKSLLDAKNRGLSIKMLYSPLEIITTAQHHPDQEFLFMAIGFETTAPATAILVKKIKEQNLKNVSILCLHVLTPPAVHAVMNNLPIQKRPQAIIGPGHVSLVTGLSVYNEIAEVYNIPIVISGFEATDLIESIYLSLEYLGHKKNDLYGHQNKVINQYKRALNENTGVHSNRLLAEVFNLRPHFTWRGLGDLPDSAFQLKDEFSEFDAEKKYKLEYQEIAEHPQCRCSDILRGLNSPQDCKLFAKACTPTRPFGACMVSSEGACHAYYESGAYA